MSVTIGKFPSLEECRGSANKVLLTFNKADVGDYECGLNCDGGNKLGGLEICDKTER
jgi:hypothetical protein